MSQTIEQLWQQISALPLPQQQELRDRLNACLSKPISEDEFEEMLEAKGMLIRPKISTKLSSHQKYTPVENKGRPLSEIIIEERR